MTTLRITNSRGENGGEWFCGPEEQSKLAYVKSLCAQMEKEEPQMGWRVETRGTQVGWHRIDSMQ